MNQLDKKLLTQKCFKIILKYTNSLEEQTDGTYILRQNNDRKRNTDSAFLFEQSKDWRQSKDKCCTINANDKLEKTIDL